MSNRQMIVRPDFGAPERLNCAPDLGQHRIVGEDAPIWSSLLLASLGAVFALAASVSVDMPGTHSVDTKRWLQLAMESAKFSPPTAGDPPAEQMQPQHPESSIHSIERQDRLAKPAQEAPTVADTIHFAHTAPASASTDCPRSLEIPFAFGSSHLESRKSDGPLRRLAEWVSKHEGAVLSIEGRVDPTGNERRNVFLSLRRARAVAERISASGLEERRIVVRVAGPNQSGNSFQAPRRERRVVLNVEGVSNCRSAGMAMGQE